MPGKVVKRHTFVATLLLSISGLSMSGLASASQGGIPGYSLNATGSLSCHLCHLPPILLAETNTLSIQGNTTVLAGSTSSYTLQLVAPDGGLLQSNDYAGFDMSTTGGLLISTSSDTQVSNSELVHSNRKLMTANGAQHEVSWGFDWQAPSTAGVVTLRACGLPVNGDGLETIPLLASIGDGLTACTTFDITVQVAPVAVSSGGVVAELSTGISLDGSLSSDADGTIAAYLWEQVSGTSVSINNATSAVASFDAPDVAANMTEELVFRLTVTDNDGLSHSLLVSFFVQDASVNNLPPIVVVGSNQNVNEGTVVTLDGSGSSDDGSIVSFLWEQVGGVNSVALTNAGTAIASFTAPEIDAASVSDTLSFRLTVVDDLGISITDTVDVVVNHVDKLPVAKITDDSGVIITAAEAGQAITLYGNFSSDFDGPIMAYSWTQTTGDPITNPGPTNQGSFTFTTPNNPGTSITIRLTVTGDEGVVQDVITQTLTLSNLPPVVSAGLDQQVTENALINLQGLVVDPNNDLVNVQWRQINCGGNCLLPPTDISLPLIAGIANISVLAPSVAAGSNQVLDFELSATDSGASTVTSQVQITVTDNGITQFPPGSITFNSFNNLPMAISVVNTTGGTTTVSSLLPEDDQSVPDLLNRPNNFIYDLTALEITVPVSGTVQVTLYFPKSLPPSFDYYEYIDTLGWVNTTAPRDFNNLVYDDTLGWIETAEEAEFNADRTSVTFLLTDGGPSDTDGSANGVITTKGGVAVSTPVTQQPGADSGGFIHPAWLMVLLLVQLRLRRKYRL